MATKRKVAFGNSGTLVEIRDIEKEKRQAAGAALKSYREKYGECSENTGLKPKKYWTQKAFASMIGINFRTYKSYETGDRRMSREDLAIICDGFLPFEKLGRLLKKEYDKIYPTHRDTRSFATRLIEKTFAHLEPETRKVQADEAISVHLYALAKKILAQYDDGHIEDACNLALAVWKMARQEYPRLKATHDLVTLFARVLSQSNRNWEALEILESAKQFLDESTQPMTRIGIEISYTSCLSRARKISGVAAAKQYERLAPLVKHFSKSEDPYRNEEWKDTWNTIQRSRISSLTDTFEPAGIEYLQCAIPDFRASEETSEREGIKMANQYVSARILSASGRAEEAFEILAGLERPKELFGDRAFLARSRIIALCQTKQFESAKWEAEQWAQKSHSHQMLHKESQFISLTNRVLKLAAHSQ